MSIESIEAEAQRTAKAISLSYQAYEAAAARDSDRLLVSVYWMAEQAYRSHVLGQDNRAIRKITIAAEHSESLKRLAGWAQKLVDFTYPSVPTTTQDIADAYNRVWLHHSGLAPPFLRNSAEYERASQDLGYAKLKAIDSADPTINTQSFLMHLSTHKALAAIRELQEVHDGKADTHASVVSQAIARGTDDAEGFASLAEILKRLDVPTAQHAAIRKRVERARAKSDSGWIENQDAAHREPSYLYQAWFVQKLIA